MALTPIGVTIRIYVAAKVWTQFFLGKKQLHMKKEYWFWDLKNSYRNITENWATSKSNVIKFFDAHWRITTGQNIMTKGFDIMTLVTLLCSIKPSQRLKMTPIVKFWLGILKYWWALILFGREVKFLLHWHCLKQCITKHSFSF